MSRLFFPVQFLAAAVLVLSARPDFDHWSAIASVSGGLLLGLWAVITIGPGRVSITPDVKPETRLVTGGPYRFIRHPMYTALLLFAGGFVFAPLHLWKIGVWFVLLFVLIAKARMEERHLLAFFDEYANYRMRTPGFVPFPW